MVTKALFDFAIHARVARLPVMVGVLTQCVTECDMESCTLLVAVRCTSGFARGLLVYTIYSSYGRVNKRILADLALMAFCLLWSFSVCQVGVDDVIKKQKNPSNDLFVSTSWAHVSQAK